MMIKIKIEWGNGNMVQYKKVPLKLADKVNNLICKELK